MDSLCRAISIDVFFPREGETRGERLRRERTAKAICQQCPVQHQCRNHAVTVDEPYGIWGGVSEADRRQLSPAQTSSADRRQRGQRDCLRIAPQHRPPGKNLSTPSTM
ncbi:MAG: WhiB family transcriptional regulator [Rhodococcus sp. (in: high G+C Gram-positive bacteria)]|nr:MAG: WhiB family transcriptional regulator [Rhodococcus sp. (in: high G+C Gram-positive bacteria)]